MGPESWIHSYTTHQQSCSFGLAFTSKLKPDPFTSNLYVVPFKIAGKILKEKTPTSAPKHFVEHVPEHNGTFRENRFDNTQVDACTRWILWPTNVPVPMQESLKNEEFQLYSYLLLELAMSVPDIENKILFSVKSLADHGMGGFMYIWCQNELEIPLPWRPFSVPANFWRLSVILCVIKCIWHVSKINLTDPSSGHLCSKPPPLPAASAT